MKHLSLFLSLLFLLSCNSSSVDTTSNTKSKNSTYGDLNNNKLNIKDLHESPLVMLIPLFLLSIGALFSGMFFKEIFIGAESSQLFWKDSIMFLEPLSKDHPPLWFLLLTPSFVIISLSLIHI